MGKSMNLIVDYSSLFRKYKSKFDKQEEGKSYGMPLERLSSEIVNDNGEKELIDTSLIYYPMREIEECRRKFESNCIDVTVTVCFDSGNNMRKHENADYKSGRKRLNEDDLVASQRGYEIFKDLQYNVLKADGYEADDLILAAVERSKDKFDAVLIMTNDKDLASAVGPRVSVYRYKWNTGYSLVTQNNFNSYFSSEFGVIEMPNNVMMLYLSTVGDTPDKIKGIPGFGKAAFNKFIAHLRVDRGIDFRELSSADKVEELLRSEEDYLGKEKVEQALEALKLVRPLDTSNVKLDEIKKITREESKNNRTRVYGKWQFISLIK